MTRVAYGVHPWYAHLVKPRWLEALRAHLNEDPRAMIGEVGLDKHARVRKILISCHSFLQTPETKRCEYSLQKEIFETQWRLACEFKRPISIHCVQAVGNLYDIIRNSPEQPPAIALHSYGSLYHQNVT